MNTVNETIKVDTATVAQFISVSYCVSNFSGSSCRNKPDKYSANNKSLYLPHIVTFVSHLVAQVSLYLGAYKTVETYNHHESQDQIHSLSDTEDRLYYKQHHPRCTTSAELSSGSNDDPFQTHNSAWHMRPEIRRPWQPLVWSDSSLVVEGKEVV